MAEANYRDLKTAAIKIRV